MGVSSLCKFEQISKLAKPMISGTRNFQRP